MLALTIVLTFVLPRVQRPRKTGLGDTGLPENAEVEGRAEDAEDPLLEPMEDPDDRAVRGFPGA